MQEIQKYLKDENLDSESKNWQCIFVLEGLKYSFEQTQAEQEMYFSDPILNPIISHL